MATLNWKTPNGTIGSIDMSTIVTTDTAQTISGEKTFSNNMHFSHTVAIDLLTDISNIAIEADPDHDHSAYLHLYGGNHGTYPGEFSLVARNPDNLSIKQLSGTPAGVLKWCNSEVLTKSDVSAGSTNGTITVYDKTVTAYTHPTTAGNKHIPSGGSSGNVLKYSSSGTAAWGDLTSSEVGITNGSSLSGNGWTKLPNGLIFQWITTLTMNGTANTVVTKMANLPIQMHALYSDVFIQGSQNPQNIHMAVVDSSSGVSQTFKLHSATTTTSGLGIKAFFIGYV